MKIVYCQHNQKWTPKHCLNQLVKLCRQIKILNETSEVEI